MNFNLSKQTPNIYRWRDSALKCSYTETVLFYWAYKSEAFQQGFQAEHYAD